MLRLKNQRAAFWAGMLLFLACGLEAPLAQQAVVTQPGGANSGEVSGTLSGTDFAQIMASTGNPANASSPGRRASCLVLNNSTHRQWVYFQGPGMATPSAATTATIKTKAVPLEAASAVNALGGYVTCATGSGQALQDAVWIAGTDGDTYVAKQQ